MCEMMEMMVLDEAGGQLWALCVCTHTHLHVHLAGC